jgi:hypothetical protein
MKRHLQVFLFSIVTLLASTQAQADPCGGLSPFTDVAQADIFCSEALWARNAMVTLGCTTATTFCPGTTVTRAQMVLFMQRLSEAVVDNVDFTESSTPPTGDLDSSGVQMCTSAPITIPASGVGSIGRYAHAQGVISIRANALADIQVRLTRSDNGGSFSTDHNEIPLVSVPGGQWAMASVMIGKNNRLDEGSTTQFRLELFRAIGSATTGEVTDIRCQLKVWTTLYFG